MKNVIYLIILFFLSCDSFDRKLKVENTTDKTLISVVSQDSAFHSPIDEYQLGVNFQNSGFDNEHLYKIPPDAVIAQYGAFNTTWDYIIDNSFNKKLNLYVFEWDSLVKYKSINALYKNNGSFKIITKTKMELENSDWTVKIK